MDHNSLVYKYIMELVYCFSVLSLGAFSLLSHHLLCAGIDKASAALKFQKVRERAIDREEKKREKKEKKHKKDKKDKRRREEDSSLKNGEQVHKKRKHDSGSVLSGKDSNSKEAGKCTVEQLEKSSLSEEHGLPSSIPEPCESSESTQNSSKSRKLEGVGTASRSNGSIVLRFKLPLKQEDPEPVPSSALPGLKVPLKKQKDTEPVPSSALPGLKLPLKMQKDPEPVPSSAFPGLKLPLKMQKVREPVPYSSSPGLKLPLKKQKDREPVPSSALPGHKLPLHKHKVPEAVPSLRLPGLKLPMETHKDPEPRPSSVLPGLNFSIKKHNDREPVPSIVSPGPNFPLKKHKDTVSVSTTALPGPMSKDPLPVPCDEEVCRWQVPECARGNEEPCFSGRTTEASRGKLEGEAGGNNSRSRQSKRNRRSDEIDNQLSNLLSSMNPLPLQGIEIADDTDNQDWLIGGSRQQHKDPGASCGVDNGAGGLGLERAATSYQPRSCFMPEFNCYQLPYVFPF